jgi:membrane peptidoglycan carboxypeptidase
VALRCRQPGSAIKPLTYLATFERGWTPSALFWDIETQFPDGANPPYVPVNYDHEYHGPMLMREALANSYNVPAVEALQYLGIDGLLEMASRLGVQSLVHPEEHCPDYPYDQPPQYGLALTLGGGEAKLLEMTGAFATLANGGVRQTPTPILRIEDSRGNVLVDNEASDGVEVIAPEHAYLITDILADTQARCREFRCPSVLELDRPVAAKTGTTNDYRDAWTIGYTPDLVTGVWVGNSDNSEMVNLPGSAGAGPIWHAFMAAAHEGKPVREFTQPNTVEEIEICADSGARPTEHCPRRRMEVFARHQPPPDAEQDWYQKVRIDAATGLLATDSCPNHVVEQVMVVIKDERGREWAQAHPDFFGGLPLAPIQTCSEAPNQALVIIQQPRSGSSVQGKVRIIGSVQLPEFDRYEVQYGVGEDPQGWGWISGPHLAQVRDGQLAEWDVTGLPPGTYTLRISAFNKGQHRFEARVIVNVAAPTATPTPTPTATATATEEPTETETPTATATATEVIEPTATSTAPPDTPTATPNTPTATATASATATPTASPTATIEPTTVVTASKPITNTEAD